MGLEDTELRIGNTSFKGIWIAIVVTIGTSIGSTVWVASSLYSRLESVEGRPIPDIVPLEEKVLLIEQELTDNDVNKLQGKLAELGVNLKTIADQQEKLLKIKEEVEDLSQQVIKMQTTVQKAELVVDKVKAFEADAKIVKREIQDLWDGMDHISSNPLQ